MSTRLLLLIVSLPPTPSSLRVRVWRRLKAIGAVALKRTVYLLPDTGDHDEQFQWLAQEVQRAGGEATLVRVERIENMPWADVVRLFHEARNADYRQLAARYRALLAALDRKSAVARRRVEAQLAQVDKELERLRDLDFFDAPGRAEVERLKEAIGMRKRPSEKIRPSAGARLDLRALRGRQWVTRPRPHVDRIASAWLIRRFIDPDATFAFAEPGEFPPAAIPFDTPGAELSHDGDDCTFETLVKQAGLRDRRLARLAEIVHEADLRDGKFARDEARGIDLAIRGLLAADGDDQRVLAHGMTLFEGLYASVSARD
ncbi:MAG TPA: chromate resistance protein ChrB domain-containing protein [Methylomirabilota bacterium]|nr:chromate resistance protein ChrB domain-containing protein [Methylomirabilota bacterium]